MVEVPEHLLKRSKEARQTLTGAGGEEGSPSEDPVPAASADAPPATPALATPQVPAEPTPPPPPAPYVTAALTRQKIPWWAAGTLLLLPIWAITYVGTLERVTREATGVLAHGAEVYERRCSSCHGATGSGGSGHQLSDGEVLVTFPQIEDHVVWVVRGSDGFGVGNPYGDPARGRIVEGGMPAFGDVLTADELIGAILHERTRFGESDQDGLLAEALDHAIHLGDLDLSGYLDPANTTSASVAELFAGVADHAGTEMAAG